MLSPSVRAACSVSRTVRLGVLVGLMSKAMRSAVGTISRIISSRFAASDWVSTANAGGIAARPVEACDETVDDRVDAGREHDGNRIPWLQAPKRRLLARRSGSPCEFGGYCR